MKHRRRIVGLLLCAILTGGMCTVKSQVSKAEDEYIIDMSDATSRVIIDATTGDGKPVVVTGNSSEYGLDISADSGENITVIFRNLTVDLSAVRPDNNANAVVVEGEGNVTIQLEGKSCLTGGPMRSAIEKTVPRSLGSNGFEYETDTQGWLTISADDNSNELIAAGGSGAAGIGGVERFSGSKIKIAGGTVTAIGGTCGAGIGGGNKDNPYDYFGNGTDIVITGGIVKAIGGDNAAGIGGGNYGHCSNVTITGGTVTAIGGDGAAGLGSGLLANCTNITVTGGTVYAVGGDGGPGIGCGQYYSAGIQQSMGDPVKECGTVSGITISGTAVVHTAGGMLKNSKGDILANGAAVGTGVLHNTETSYSDGAEVELCTTGEVGGETVQLTGKINKYKAGTTLEQMLAGEAQTVEFVLTFDPNGGEGSMEPLRGTTGLRIPLPKNAFTRKGYAFLGWSYNPDSVSSTVGPDDIVVSHNSVTLYAVWNCVLVKTEAVEATCTTDGHAEYWSCDTCEEKFLDGEGNTVATEEDIVIPATGHKWKPATADAPKTCEVCGATEGEPIQYSSQGGETVEWESGDLVLTFKSNEAEDTSFEKYRETLIDGAPVEADVKRGSTIVTIAEATLRTLPAGEHTVTVVFSDGTSEVKLEVEKTAETGRMESPKTGDGLPAAPLAAAVVIAVTGLCFCALRRREAAK